MWLLRRDRLSSASASSSLRTSNHSGSREWNAARSRPASALSPRIRTYCHWRPQEQEKRTRVRTWVRTLRVQDAGNMSCIVSLPMPCTHHFDKMLPHTRDQMWQHGNAMITCRRRAVRYSYSASSASDSSLLFAASPTTSLLAPPPPFNARLPAAASGPQITPPATASLFPRATA